MSDRTAVLVSLMQSVCNHERALDALEHQLNNIPTDLSENQRNSRMAVLTIAINLIESKRDGCIDSVRSEFEVSV